MIAEDYDLEADSTRVLEALWNISKCKRIVMEQRKRLLYKDDIWKELLAENTELLTLMVSGMSKYLGDFQDLQYNIDLNEEAAKTAQTVAADVDIMSTDTLMQIRTSIKDDADIGSVLGLLLQSAITSKNISKLVLINPLRGFCHEFNIAGWNKHHELLNYCLKKRQALISASSS